MPHKGYKQTNEHRQNTSVGHKGKKYKPMSEQGKKNLSLAHLGNRPSESTRNKMGESHSGEKCHWWQGGITNYERKLWLNNRRRVVKLGNGGYHSQGEWETLKAQYNWTCPCCKISEPEIKLTEDHIVPLDKGGSDNIENIQPLCKSCNCRKHTKIIKYNLD